MTVAELMAYLQDKNLDAEVMICPDRFFDIGKEVQSYWVCAVGAVECRLVRQHVRHSHFYQRSSHYEGTDAKTDTVEAVILALDITTRE